MNIGPSKEQSFTNTTDSISELPIDDLFEIVDKWWTEPNRSNQLIQFIEKAPLEAVVETINRVSDVHKTSLFGYSAHFCETLCMTILNRIQLEDIDFSKVSYSSLNYIIGDLVNDSTRLYIEQLGDANLNLNALPFREDGKTLFYHIIERDKPGKILLKVLQTFPLKNVNFNILPHAHFPQTPLNLVIRKAVMTNNSEILDVLIKKAPFANLNFNAKCSHLGRNVHENVISWLSITPFAYYVPKFLEAGIQQCRELFDNLLATIDSNGKVDEAKIKIYEDHLEKLEEFVNLAKNEICKIMLENFYDYINAKTYIENGDLASLKALIGALPMEHSFRSEICDILAEAMVYKIDFTTDNNNNKKIPKEKLLEALNYALEGKDSFPPLAMNYIDRSSFPQNNSRMLGWLREIKTPVAPEDKKMILTSLKFLRNNEKLKNTTNNLKITKLNQKIEILASELAGSPVLTFSRAQTCSNNNVKNSGSDLYKSSLSF